MAQLAKSSKLSRKTGLYHAREARGMSRSKLVKLSGVSKQQLSRLENGQIRLRLDHLKPFAAHVGYTPEQMLLWGRYPGTESEHTEPSETRRDQATQRKSVFLPAGQVPELDTSADPALSKTKLPKAGRHAGAVKSEGWVFRPSFVREQLHTSVEQLLVLDTSGDSMAPTLTAGDRVIIDTGHKSPTPDGLYAIRDSFKQIVVKRLQLLRSTRAPRIKIISDNPKHAAEELPLVEIEIVGKVLCYLKLV